jgi:radical SAM superfamily enzyme YgiQ (UPF0313 family)
MKRIALVAPAIEKYLLRPRAKAREVRAFRFSLLSLLTVAACTPPGYEIEIIDEHIDHLDFDMNADVVGVSFMTGHAPRAYEIGDAFLARGKTVVFGGFHPSFLPQEALRHASAVVVGEAENSWPVLLADLEKRSLKRVYRSRAPVDLAALTPPPRRLLEPKARQYMTINTVQASRGCGNRCDFCSIHRFYGGGYRTRPVDKVVEEVRAIPGRYILFIDDNILGDRDYARALFQALVPLKKRWISQASLELVRDPDLLDLAAAGGCRGLFVGLETLNQANLRAAGKSFNRVEEYGHAVDLLHGHGIGVEAALMFGFDHDDVTAFERTLAFVEQAGIDAVQVSIVTPLPGTRLYERMAREGRIVDHDWRRYDYRHVVFTPAGMTASELQNGADWFIREFYRPRRVARRLTRGFLRGSFALTAAVTLPLNAAYHIDARRWKIRGVRPSRRPAA